MIENERAKLERPPISRKSCCAWPGRARSRASCSNCCCRVGRGAGILGVGGGAYAPMVATAMGYRLVRGFVRLLLWLFYRRVDVVGAERIPSRGPLIIVANHHNSLVDPMLIMGTFPRRITAVAKAPLFRHPLIGPFLRAVGALPVHRREEAGDDPRQKEALFARSGEGRVGEEGRSPGAPYHLKKKKKEG